jgi:hypothetical protein
MRSECFTDPQGESFMGTLQFHGGLNEAYRAIDIYAFVEEDGPDKSRCREFSILTQLDRHLHCSQHRLTFRLQTEQAQQLMDLLWRSNVRPAEVGSTGQFSAMQAHLADLQKLLFDPSPYGVSLIQLAMDRVAELQRQLECANKTIQSLLSPVCFYNGDSSQSKEPTNA